MTCASCATELDGILYSQRSVELAVVQGSDNHSSLPHYLVNKIHLQWPPPLLPPPPPMTVSGLGCAATYDGQWPGRCVRSTGYYGTGYSNNEACTITNPPAVPISVTSFSVEAHSSCAWDHLTVNGALYCGSNSPDGIVSDGTSIEWRTDGNTTGPGWELCFPVSTAYVNCGNPCTSQTIDLESVGLKTGNVYTVRLRETNAAWFVGKALCCPSLWPQLSGLIMPSL